MSQPAGCPVCGSKVHLPNEKEGRWFFECGAWMADGDDWPKEVGIVCYERRKIKDAATVIQAFLDGDKDAREHGFNWIADNAP
jgi:hypothetical protein